MYSFVRDHHAGRTRPYCCLGLSPSLRGGVFRHGELDGFDRCGSSIQCCHSPSQRMSSTWTWRKEPSFRGVVIVDILTTNHLLHRTLGHLLARCMQGPNSLNLKEHSTPARRSGLRKREEVNGARTLPKAVFNTL
jgi:hypothetical protein